MHFEEVFVPILLQNTRKHASLKRVCESIFGENNQTDEGTSLPSLLSLEGLGLGLPS